MKTFFQHKKALRREFRRADPEFTSTMPSKTDQSMVEDSDINVITQRMLKTGYVPPFRAPGEYRDTVLESSTLQEAHMLIDEARKIFDKLPSKTRLHFKKRSDATPRISHGRAHRRRKRN